MPQSWRVQHGRVTLKTLEQLSQEDWRRFFSYFRDREIADWNGAKPTRYPFWLFKRLMMDDVNALERFSFGMYDELERFMGSVELYDLHPYPPATPKIATLGIVIGERERWGKGYGREAVRAALKFAFSRLPSPLERVRLTTFLHNKRAQSAFKSAGFRQVGVQEQVDHTDVLMEISRLEWLEEQESGREGEGERA
jgi:RimJ/RimL family protein N-acetyltransferase